MRACTLGESSVIDARFLKPDDAEWQEILSRARHDFYHLPSFVSLSAAHDGGEGEAVVVSDGRGFFFLPYLVRRLEALPWLGSDGHELFDAISPYGYPGPLVSSSDPGFLAEALRIWADAMRGRCVVSAFIRLHPLMPVDAVDLGYRGEVVQRGQTVSVDLTQPLEEIWHQTRSGHRNEINKARRLGLTARMDEEFLHLDDFVRIYHETMRRAGASDYYFFPRSYFDGLRETLGKRLWLCVANDADGHIVSAALFTECCGIVQYHLSGTPDSALRLRPSKLALDFARNWAKDRGNDVMHLGGGVGSRNDSLFEFKAGFSKTRHDFVTWHLVFMPDVYDELKKKRDSILGPAEDAGYFPAYRA